MNTSRKEWDIEEFIYHIPDQLVSLSKLNEVWLLITLEVDLLMFEQVLSISETNGIVLSWTLSNSSNPVSSLISVFCPRSFGPSGSFFSSVDLVASARGTSWFLIDGACGWITAWARSSSLEAKLGGGNFGTLYSLYMGNFVWKTCFCPLLKEPEMEWKNYLNTYNFSNVYQAAIEWN